VLLNEEFKSILNALMWGRIIYTNIRKFLQFQLAINIVIMVVVLLGSIIFGHSPLTPVQLLWINVITDMLGVLALVTEPPTYSVLLN
jgi:magnesium-transporting ATPase (P-type)